MKNNQRRGIIAFFLFVPLFIYFSFSFYYDVIQYFLKETNFTEGKLIETSMSPAFTNFYYNYYIGSHIYKGNMDLFIKYNLENEIFTVRYLVNDPSKSVINEYILRETIFYCIFTGITLFIQISCILLFLGIKTKWIR